ncbi:hypothetical protein CAOG_02888 [Capsaspora owczarzaki ATCC 30864]|uniref:G-protein coupled receptors family 3 profile domain-containing protein n=1 Tax=Capsaspora owczarzaki (strain ATCC 30864) TaxID=595528 RepID=A0A0D2X222_CAPO3|nr:hypothetical protein CAOG_02888 [Capsaspora owczarzaki ATCC 30864]KJE91804.1 hypothetical protein CAOG_002888 [Capsaspora owczarzaki ATCC 30864]|eukprot:XP_004363727.2 hypothetical protein CAOG_02888 [Capsaspora owczarzaki ATCC 30864]
MKMQSIKQTLPSPLALLLLVAAIMLGCGSLYTADATTVLKVGVLTDRTGPGQSTSIMYETVFNTFLQFYNLGYLRTPMANYTVALEYRDFGGNPNMALYHAQDLAANAHVVAVIGAGDMISVGAAALVLNQYGIPLLAYSVTTSLLSVPQIFPTFLRTVSNDLQQAQYIAEFVLDMGWNRVAIVSSNGVMSSADSISVVFRDSALTGHPIEIVMEQPIISNDFKRPDFEMQQLKDSSARVILLLTTEDDAINVLASANSLGLLGPDYVWIVPDLPLHIIPDSPLCDGLDSLAVDAFCDFSGLTEMYNAGNVIPGSSLTCAGFAASCRFLKRVPSAEERLSLMNNMRGLIGVRGQIVASPAYVAANQMFMATFGQPLLEYSLHAYDAMDTIVRGLENFTTTLHMNGIDNHNFTLADGPVLMEIMRAETFVGLTGLVTFSGVDRISNFEILNWAAPDNETLAPSLDYDVDGTLIDFSTAGFGWVLRGLHYYEHALQQTAGSEFEWYNETRGIVPASTLAFFDNTPTIPRDYPCHAQCKPVQPGMPSSDGCSGPGADQCTICNNAIFNNTCVAACPIGHFSSSTVMGQLCSACHNECSSDGCSGPAASQCVTCLHFYDSSSLACTNTCMNGKINTELSRASSVSSGLVCVHIDSLTDAVIAVILTFTGVLLFLCGVLVVMIVVFRDKKVMRSASPTFLLLMVFGTATSLSSIFLLAVDNPTNDYCMAAMWIRHMGFAIAFGALFLKTYRIAQVFRAKSSRAARALRDDRLLLKLFQLCLLFAVYLLIWSLAHPPQVELKETPSHEQFHTCDRDWFFFGLLIAELMLLAMSAWLCFITRKAPSAFNELRQQSLAIYNWTLILLILEIVVNTVANDDANAVFALSSLELLLTQGFAVMIVLLPKAVAVLRGEGDKVNTSTHQAGSGPSGKHSGTNGHHSSSSGEISGLDSMSGAEVKERLVAAVKETKRLMAEVEQLRNVAVGSGNRHLAPSASKEKSGKAKFAGEQRPRGMSVDTGYGGSLGGSIMGISPSTSSQPSVEIDMHQITPPTPTLATTVELTEDDMM